MCDTFPMIQCGAWRAAHACGVVRVTGGAGGVTSRTDALLAVVPGTTVHHTHPVLEQGSRVRTDQAVLLACTDTLRTRWVTVTAVCVVVLV